MTTAPDFDRRRFVIAGAAAALGLVACSSGRSGGSSAGTASHGEGSGAIDLAPTEDLMREHGLLDRILLIYEEAMRQPQVPWPTVASSARIIRTFIEDYHEKLEEEHLFPRLERAGTQVDLVSTLRQQHQAGRLLTQRIERTAGGSPHAEDRQMVADAITQFIRMYRPHAAREDTVLFPAFKTVVTKQEFDELGDQFEVREHELFGKDGFEGMLAQVSQLERSLGIEDLSRFTPSPA